MHSLHSWPIFPAHLEPKAACSLSLQFLLQELFLTFDLLEALRVKITPPLDLSMELEGISLKLEQFLLFSLEDPIAPKERSLEKLSFYSEILLQNSHTNKNTELLIHLEETKTCVLQVKSKLTLFKNTGSQKEETCRHLIRLIQESQNHLKNLFDSLFPYLLEFYEDENILFLLIEQKEKINQYLGCRTVEIVLSRLFPEGLSTLRTALYNGYARRGFLDFYSRNEELIDALEWEDSCSLSTPTR